MEIGVRLSNEIRETHNHLSVLHFDANDNVYKPNMETVSG